MATTVFAIHANAATHLMISRAVASVANTELTGRTASAVEAQRVVESLAPDLVTVDLRLPDGDGIALAERLRTTRPHLPVLVVGAATHRLLERALTAGVAAYVSREAGAVEVAAAIRACLSGGGSYSAHTLNAALRQHRTTGLSRREREVYDLLRAGLTPAVVADELGLGESTVRTYVARVRAKTAGGGDLPQAG
ncbi:two-component system, NarL family, response regulator DesR [Asanoa hainanensis]|uniref:Two-component system, NarL family, response regulator DesR n=1 Tax=Asanoa hainanensis TaxID=560556 RepID=A0A239NKA1_9ACTN|nr:response regulator transcription factor [Asanoa hainanensis]SNT54834.1 two-component system, NarL family, response regulator DesR [Asanoa hainanensis]